MEQCRGLSRQNIDGLVLNNMTKYKWNSVEGLVLNNMTKYK